MEECLVKKDIVFANRPHVLSGRILNYNDTTMGTADYGDHWRNLRRISAIEIFSSTRLNAFLGMRKDEVKLLLSRLYRVSIHGFAKVELRPLLFDLTSNIMMRTIAGKRYYGEGVKEIDKAREFREIMEEFIHYSGAVVAGDFLPFLQWLDLNGYMSKLDRLSERMDAFFQGLIDEHRVDRNRNTMISHFLTLQESQPEYYTDEIIKGHVLTLLVAGIETSATSLEWAVANLLNQPEVLKKAKEELDTQVGQNELIDESDLPKLHYLHDIISENLRLYPVAPLLLPHMSSADSTVGGYQVPARTMLFINAWAIHRDPTLWDEPTSFKPERFENGRVDQAYKLMPFGLGRRACPGDGLAKRVMALTLGSLIQCFEWKRVSEKEIDMAEFTTITICKVEPLVAMCKARPILDNVLSRA